MKLVITTQIHENYGAHNWDGEGECPQYWKAKGGENYVVQHLTPEQAIEATKPGGLAERLGNAVTIQDDPAFEEYVLGYHLLDNDEPVGEEWETPWMVSGNKASRYVKAEDYWQPGYKGKTESYTMLEGGERTDYQQVYIELKQRQEEVV